MQPINQPTVLPTVLDRASAEVLGFDATAYLNNTQSTMHQRLGIPQNFNSSDYLAGNLAKANEERKNNVSTFIKLGHGALVATALTVVGIKAGKGENIITKATSKISEFFGSGSAGMKEKVAKGASSLLEKARELPSKATELFGKIFKKVKP